MTEAQAIADLSSKCPCGGHCASRGMCLDTWGYRYFENNDYRNPRWRSMQAVARWQESIRRMVGG